MSKPRIALVTGANKGIGLETARQLAQQGITVFIGSRDAQKGEKAAAQLRAEGHAARSLQLDVTNAEHRRAAHDAIAEEFGKLDILVNNAGIAPEVNMPAEVRFKPSLLSIDTAREVLETNFLAGVALTQVMLPLMHKSSAGRIVNVSSRLGSLSRNAAPPKEWYDELAYNASKASLLMFTILLARELKETPIKVNAAHPGMVQTDMLGPFTAPMDVSEGARTSVWLATLPEEGPTGGFFHQQEALAW